MVLQSFAIGLALVGLSTPVASAHILQNMGLEEQLDVIPNLRDAQPIADQEVQRMAIDMSLADCETLNALDESVKESFLVSQMFLQRKGALSFIVGPKCTFAGPFKKIAEISDPTLTLTSNKEDMYYLTEMHAILVSHRQRDTIAYGMFYHGDDDPVNFFLEHRTDAKRAADLARLFLETVGFDSLSTQSDKRSSLRIITFSESSAATVAAQSSLAQATTSVASAVSVAGQATTSSAAAVFSTPFSEGSTVGTESSAVEGQTSSDGTVSSIRNIEPEPIGPEAPPPETGSSLMLWIALLLFVVITVILIIAYRKMRASPESDDEQPVEDSEG